MGASLYSFLQSEFFKTGGTALTKERRQELRKPFLQFYILPDSSYSATADVPNERDIFSS
jgi:hypothetical protein